MGNRSGIQEEKEPTFKESKDLKNLANEILAADTKELASARKFKWGIIFTNGKLTHHKAAYCRKLDGALSFKAGIDFLIVVQYVIFMQAKPLTKVETIVHELYHIRENDNGQPAIREHDEDFCEIPSHDKFSREIAQRIIKDLPTIRKLPYQTTIEEQQDRRSQDELGTPQVADGSP